MPAERPPEDGAPGERPVRSFAQVIVLGADRGGRSAASSARSFAVLDARRTRLLGRRAARRVAFAIAGCAMVAGAGGFWARAHLAEDAREPLTYTLGGSTPLPPGEIPTAGITTAPSAEPVLSFSDGTRVAMGPRARGRVVALGRRGARVALDDGKAHVAVVHRPGAEWLFEAGPFLINVHGTSFFFAWNARDAHFDLHMETGVVSVTGPVSGGEIVLRAGESLSVGLHDRAAGEPAAAVPARAAVAAAPVAPAPQAHADEPSPEERPPAPAEVTPRALAVARPRAAHRAVSAAPAPATSWVRLLADGHAAAILADAERRGLGRVLVESPSEELAALADAARYQRDEGLARRALLAQRHRFPRTARAAEASFLLGRLDDETAGGGGRALDWYDRYLSEAPGGAYVSEAMGRKMMTLERGGRRVEAAAIAGDYERRFPSGTYAHAAEALLRAP